MERFQQSKMSLKVVTPLCIAGGKEITPLDYIYDSKDDKLYLIKKNKWNSFILERKLFDSYLDFVQHSQERARGQKSFNLLEWLNDNQIDIKDVRQAGCLMAETPVYGGKKPNEIAWHIRQGDGKVYIPGSSIKGYFRTAILYNLIKKNEQIRDKYWKKVDALLHDVDHLHELLSDIIADFKEKRADNKRKHITSEVGLKKYVTEFRNAFKDEQINPQKLIDKLGKIGDELEDELLNILVYEQTDDEQVKDSVMKGIQISDALPVGTVKTKVLPKSDLIFNERKIIFVNGRKYIAGPIYEHAPGAYAECIDINGSFEFFIKLDTFITRKIGINTIDDILKISEQFTSDITGRYEKVFGQKFPEIFKEMSITANLGLHTGFLRKTIFMALALKDKDGYEALSRFLDISFASVLSATKNQNGKRVPERPWMPKHWEYAFGKEHYVLEFAPRAIKVFPKGVEGIVEKDIKPKPKHDTNDMLAGMVYIREIQ